ncbi:hypothetical protein E2C01_022063 [Portunus trituberculatus]|uniref:Uncharacterized protein n=1 Tax=Portunus trituberculatus TaxID=210409 RepID=A0A5B7E490_PORTR|nr:hypothetical protein [Portunus trituberculatus]
MRGFHGILWAKGDTFWGTSYLKAHPLGNRCPDTSPGLLGLVVSNILELLFTRSSCTVSPVNWNSLLISVFPSSYDLTSFKREVSRQLSLNFD